MKFLTLVTFLILGFVSTAIARVAQIAPNGDIVTPQSNIVYTRAFKEPAFYETPLFVAIAVFVALITGLLIGLFIARRQK